MSPTGIEVARDYYSFAAVFHGSLTPSPYHASHELCRIVVSVVVRLDVVGETVPQVLVTEFVILMSDWPVGSNDRDLPIRSV